MAVLLNLQKKIIAFRDKRQWKDFHKPKDIALSLVLEAAEVLELFQWKSEEDIKKYLKSSKGKKAMSEEISDVLYWILLMSHDFDIDLEKAFLRKMKINEKKYPIRKTKNFARTGAFKKYTEL